MRCCGMLNLRFASWLAATLVCCPLLAAAAFGQAPKGDVKPTDPMPAVKYHALVPGLSTAQDVRQALADRPGPPERLEAVASRVDRLRCLGNAVVPQVAQWIGQRILERSAE